MKGFHSPGFGSHLIIELWSARGDHQKIGGVPEDKEEEGERYFVKFYYNGEYLKDNPGEDFHYLDKILGISNKVIKNFAQSQDLRSSINNCQHDDAKR